MLKLLRYIAVPLLWLLACAVTDQARAVGNKQSVETVSQNTPSRGQLSQDVLNADACCDEQITHCLPVVHNVPGPQSAVWLVADGVHGLSRLLNLGASTKIYQRNTRLTSFYRLLLFPFHVFW